jgi:hypothetical protein
VNSTNLAEPVSELTSKRDPLHVCASIRVSVSQTSTNASCVRGSWAVHLTSPVGPTRDRFSKVMGCEEPGSSRTRQSGDSGTGTTFSTRPDLNRPCQITGPDAPSVTTSSPSLIENRGFMALPSTEAMACLVQSKPQVSAGVTELERPRRPVRRRWPHCLSDSGSRRAQRPRIQTGPYCRAVVREIAQLSMTTSALDSQATRPRGSILHPRRGT